MGTPWAGRCPPSPHQERQPAVLRVPRRLLVLLAVVAAHTAVLVVLLEEDKRLPPEGGSDNAPAMVWLPLTEPQARPVPAPTAPPPRAARARARRPPEGTDRVSSEPTEPRVLAPPSPENEPAITAPPSVDWQVEMGAAVTDRLAREDQRRRRESIFAAPAAPASLAAPLPRGPQFHWDYAATHRVEFTPRGSLFINLNDRCLYMFPIFLLCRFGEIPSHGDLFQHVKDRPAAEDRSALESASAANAPARQ